MQDSGHIPRPDGGRRRRLLVGMVVASWMLVAILAMWLVLLGDDDQDPPVLVVATRLDPTDLLSDPGLLLAEPGILGLAIQQEASRVVGACMAEAGFAYDGVPGIERVTDIDVLLATGYGLGQSLTLDSELVDLAYLEQLSRGELDDYETALYGGPLRQLVEGALPAGCARAGLEATLGALADLEGMRPSLGQLFEADVNDERWQTAGDRWFGCMADQLGSISPIFDSPVPLVPDFFDFRDPDGLISILIANRDGPLAAVLAGVETATARADAVCRDGFATATSDTVVDFARVFTQDNAAVLRALLGGSDG